MGFCVKKRIMKSMMFLLLFLALGITVNISKVYAATMLNPGDVVIIAINGDKEDPNYDRGFSFMPLVNLEAETVINFTDYGWSDVTGAFITNAGIADSFIHYTTPAGGVTAGTVIRCDSFNHGNFTFDYTYSGVGSNPYLNTAGLSSSDELLVFQGSRNAPTFIAAATFVTSGWATNVGTDGLDTNLDGTFDGAGSALPGSGNASIADLVDDVTALSFNQVAGANDNSSYSGLTTAATKEEWQARIQDYSKWTFNDAPTIPVPPTGPFTVIMPVAAPTITTQAVSNITTTTATGNGNVTSLGSPNPTAHGVCWNTTGNPTITDNKVDNGEKSSTGAFTASMTGLSASTTYYVKSYATNTAGTIYGTEVTFTTSAAGPSPITEHFTTETVGNSSFSEGGADFTITGSKLKITTLTAYGLNDDFFVENRANAMTTASAVGSFQCNSNDFYINSLYLITLDEDHLIVKNNNITIRGKLDGVEKFTYTVPYDQINNSSTDNYYTFVDLSSKSSFPIDTLEFIVDPFESYYVHYLMIDDFKFTVIPNVSSSDATLKSSSTVKGQTVTGLGTPNATLGSETAGTVTLTAAKAADTSNDGSFITLFDRNEGNATVKAVKYASGGSTDNFSTDAVYANEAVTNGDFFIIKVTAQDTATVNYYRINVTVTAAPSITTQAVSSIGTTTATGNGNVTSLGVPDPTAHGVCWNTTGTPTISDSKADNGAKSSTGAFTAAMTGLVPNTTYHVRAYATNAADTSYGEEVDFATLAAVPTAATNAASGVSSTGATLNGTVNANNASTTVSFEYGLTNAYGSAVTAEQSPVTGTADTSVSKSITGLSPNTTYHYRTKGVNAAGTTNGSDQTFTTPAVVPTATTGAASGVGATGATLNGTVNANNASTAVTFEYGLTTAYGSAITADQSPVTGTAGTSVSKMITGLLPNTTYHYRVKGVNSGGTTNGSDQTFSTSAIAPTVSTNAASGISSTGATLNGTVNANNASTTVSFEYGLTNAYGSAVTAEQSPVTGTADTSVSKSITGLSPNTTYHYRAKGVNAAGTTNGSDQTFTTPAVVPTATTGAASGVGATGAALNGTMNANNASTTVTFEYGLTNAYGSAVTADQSPVTGTAGTSVSKTITGILPNTTYHFRVVGVNTGGTTNGSDQTFTTSAIAPAVITNAASALSTTGATLNATVNANNASTTATFEYGLTIGYGTAVTGDQSPVTGTANTSVSKVITGLSPNTTYHYRAIGVNGTGTTNGSDQTFTTSASATSNNSGGGGGGGGSSTPAQPSPGPVNVVVNGKDQSVGNETKATEDGKTTVTVGVNNKAIESKIDEAIKNNTTGTGNVIQVSVTDTKSEVAKVELTGDTVKKLEQSAFDVSIKRDNVEYIISAEEFTISKVAEKLGIQEKDLDDIKVEVKITKLDEKVVKKYNEVAKANGAELVFPPVEFEIAAKTIKTDGTTQIQSINKFSNYVERVMEIPAGVNPSKLTTGIVFNPDGTYSHVPTEVYQKNGKWYARLNSLTNSNYSVVWNPVTVKSVEGHWSKDTVNDMASRLVIFNTDSFDPDKGITRADFAEYIIRALGLYREGSIHGNKYRDVNSTGERTLAILTASEYGIVTGYVDETFRPDQQITREEAMVMYQRAMTVTKLEGADKTRYLSYTDHADVSAWAAKEVDEVLSAHVFNGTGSSMISPKEKLTYAEAAQAVRNLLVESKLINK